MKEPYELVMNDIREEVKKLDLALRELTKETGTIADEHRYRYQMVNSQLIGYRLCLRQLEDLKKITIARKAKS